LPVIRISPEWATSPEQVQSSGRIATLASGRACLRMAFPLSMMKLLYRCTSVIASVVGMVYHKKVRMTVG